MTASFGTLLKTTLIVDGVQKALEGLHSVVHLGIAEFSEHQKVVAQTNAAIASTGGIAGVTAKKIDALALSLSNLSGVDDEVVQSGANILLSFTNIRDQVGKGNDIFSRATKDALDFAVRTGRDVPAAARILGTALENPARKATALSRAGIVLTAAQLKLIKSLQSSGHALDAQKLILTEIEKRFRGAAKAAGSTLSGQLNVLRDRFKDLAGSGVALIAPAVTKAVTGLTAFVKKLSEAQGARAKFHLVVTGLENIGRDIFNKLKAAFDAINWQAVADVAVAELRTIGKRVSDVLGSIDFGQVGRTVGNALVRGLSTISAFIRSVDWQAVGKEIIRGFGIAIGRTASFLAHVPWGRIIGASIRLAVEAIKALASLFLGAGKALAQGLFDGIVNGLAAVKDAVQKKALEIALAVIKPLDFKILGKRIIPGVHSLVNSIEGELDDLATHAANTGKKVQDALTPKAAGSRHTFVPGSKPKAAGTTTVVDSSLGLADATTTAADKANKALQTMLARLQLGVDKAGLTKTLKDDVAANAALISALQKQIVLHKDDLSLQQQLVSAQAQRNSLIEQQAALGKAARDAQQFRSLGLDATGGPRVPGKESLGKLLKRVTGEIGGTALDTTKNRSVLTAIRKLILDPTTKVSAEVRKTIQGMLTDIDRQFQNHATARRRAPLDTQNLLRGIGLDPAKIRLIQAGVAKLPAIQPAFAGAATGGGTVVVNHVSKLDGRVLERSTTRFQQKRRQRNPLQRRG